VAGYLGKKNWPGKARGRIVVWCVWGPATARCADGEGEVEVGALVWVDHDWARNETCKPRKGFNGGDSG